MRITARDYRQQLYHLRAHPNDGSDFTDNRDSLVGIYASLLPFLIFEYCVEAFVDLSVSGLVFPLGFLLYWGFYYTYYRPGFLEERLVMPSSDNLAEIPALLLGVAIWFVKVSVVEAFDFLVLRWFRPKKTRQIHIGRHSESHSRSQARSRPQANPHSRPHANTGAGSYHYSTSRPAQAAPQTPGLPSDVLQQLAILGLGECRDWNIIHKRYRELAKLYHPDLNREITEVGRRFMTYDGAYRKLLAVKEKYFFERRAL